MSLISGIFGSGEVSSANTPKVTQLRGAEIGPAGTVLQASFNRVVWAKAELDRAVAAEIQAQVGRHTAARVIQPSEATVTKTFAQPSQPEAQVYRFPVERVQVPQVIPEETGVAANVVSLGEYRDSDERQKRIREAQEQLDELHGNSPKKDVGNNAA